MLDVLHVAPTLGISVLEPDECSSNVARAMLGVVHDDRLFAPSRHEDLNGVIVIAIGALVERALSATRLTASSGRQGRRHDLRA
jgi:hypothetical protein